MEANKVTSRHLRSSTELLLVAPIRPGFVQVSELCSYSARLRTLLEALFELRRVAIERDSRMLKGPVERLQTIHRVQWTVLEAERSLLVTAHFDRSWEDYFQLLVDIDGPLLDLVFSHCDGFTGFTCADGYDLFARYIREHQRPCDFLYASNPELTLDDARYLAKMSTKDPLTKEVRADLRIESVSTEAEIADATAALSTQQRAERKQGIHDAAIALYDLRKRFFSNREELPASRRARARTGHELFDEAIKSLLGQELAQLVPAELPVEVGTWTEAFKKTPAVPATQEVVGPTAADLAEIQGNVLQGYPNMVNGCVALVRCDGEVALGQLLGELTGQVTTQTSSQLGDKRVNVALTYGGLQRLGLGDGVLAQFPKEFREGMEARAGLLGDVGDAHPSHWKRPLLNWPEASDEEIELSAIDLVVTLQVPTPGEWSPDALLRDLKLDDSKLGRHILHVQPLRRDVSSSGAREHFGFREDDAVSSQPWAKTPGSGLDLTAGKPTADKVNPGELILGYANARDKVAACADQAQNPDSAVLFKNATFMAMRKLRQNVQAFDDYAVSVERARLGDQKAVVAAESTERIKTMLVGRKLDGAPLVVPPVVPESNDFSFKGDDDGGRCPLHSHIRLANPRVETADARLATPRIARRGFSYGPRRTSGEPNDVDRGLLFMGYNASIAGQFEVIQRWLNAGNPTGLDSTQNDTLASTLPHTEVPRFIKIDGVVSNMPPRTVPLVALQWGLYLFVPSKQGMTWLAGQPAVSKQRAAYDAAVARGRVKIQELDRITQQPDEKIAIREWKNTLEEPSNFEQASDVWFAIHADGGVKDTPYGVLVANEPGAQTVLGDTGERFSVREYYRRLKDTTGPHYLAFDDVPAAFVRTAIDNEYLAMMKTVSYRALSALPNQYFGAITQQGAFSAAYGYTRAFLANPQTYDLKGDPGRLTVRLRDLARVVVAKLAQAWLGLPGGGASDDVALVESLERFVLTSRYAFQPHPEQWVEPEVNPGVLRNQYPVAGTIGRDLLVANVSQNEAQDALIGAVVGFAAPAVGCIISVIDLWTEKDMLPSMALLARSEQSGSALTKALLAALVRRPVPPTLYRMAMEHAQIGDLPIAPGKLVVVSLSAAMLDAQLRNPEDRDTWRWLFGGAHGSNPGDGKPPHGCPAREPALGVLLGVVQALFEQRSLRRVRRGVLSYASYPPP